MLIIIPQNKKNPFHNKNIKKNKSATDFIDITMKEF